MIRTFIFAFVAFCLLSATNLFAQKVALVDMEYVLAKVPAYEMMNRQLEDISKKWQQEVNAMEQEAQVMYKKYQDEVVFLTSDQKKVKEEAIVAKEKAAYDLKHRYFGPSGELIKKREALMQPIREEVWKHVKDVALSQGYQVIIDKSSSKIVYADPALDLSALLLERMGFAK